MVKETDLLAANWRQILEFILEDEVFVLGINLWKKNNE